jgi:Subtilase family
MAPTPTERSLDQEVTNSKLQIPNEADAEVALDIQLAGAAYAVATNKPATVVIYWTRNLTAGLVAATADKCDVYCITWGADEQTWGRAAADAFNAAAKAAIDIGMIIVAASGDNDSSDGGPTPSNVDFPASSPYVIGCGGTSLVKPPKGADGQKAADKKLRDEKVWNDDPGDPNGDGTGGGFSEFFSIPNWQLGTMQATMRMVPDVAAHADPASGYKIVVGGQSHVVGGTSAAAALYPGLLAAFGPKRGFILPELYKNQVCFNDIQSGDNGMFRALVGPDACTGLGSPRAARLAERVGSDAATLERVRKELRDTQRAHETPGSLPPLSVTSPAVDSIFQGYSLELRPRLVAPGAAIDPRSIVYSVLNISSGDDPIKTDARTLSDFGFSSQANFQGLTTRIDRTPLASGASYNQLVDHNAVMNCKNVGDLITKIRLYLAS